jgi:SAM-dependent methyltransferase
MTLIDNRTEGLTVKAATSACRSCGRTGMKPVLDLGTTPLADRLLSSADAAEETWPLSVAFCPHCTLVQILETVPPDVLFCNDYPYYSSFSDELLAHSRKNALALIASRNLTSDSFVVELASNDGYMLKNFVEHGIPVLGIDPAAGPAAAAEKVGVPTMNTFFTRDLAKKLRDEGKRADVIIANNVLAHVADTNGFVAGIRTLLKDTGVAVIEAPYIKDLIEHGEFDTIYHQHLCYFSVSAVDALARRHNLYLNHIEHLPIHGGSLRFYLEPVECVGSAVRAMLEEERRLGIDEYPYYQNFGRRVEQIRVQLRELLGDLKSQGKRIAGYAAAAKACTLLNYAGLGVETFDYIVDRNVHKHGKFMSGIRVPIFGVEKLLENQPDYVVILAWNFKDEIMRQQAEYARRGGKFIVPIPKPQII